jgi:hypothetical protein
MKKKTTSIILVAIVVMVIAFYLLSPLFIVKEMNDSTPQGNAISQSNFIADKHEVSGKAILINQNNLNYLRFENFETVNGPNLHIYLATDTSGEDFIDLGKIKATKGNVNYEIPVGTDIEKYDTVLVWCVPFKVLFSYAEFPKL